MVVEAKTERLSRFGAVVEAVETLPLEEQEMLVDLMRYRLIEQRREEIAANIARTREEYRQGQVRRGTVDDLMAELSDRRRWSGVPLLSEPSGRRCAVGRRCGGGSSKPCVNWPRIPLRPRCIRIS